MKRFFFFFLFFFVFPTLTEASPFAPSLYQLLQQKQKEAMQEDIKGIFKLTKGTATLFEGSVFLKSQEKQVRVEVPREAFSVLPKEREKKREQFKHLSLTILRLFNIFYFDWKRYQNADWISNEGGGGKLILIQGDGHEELILDKDNLVKEFHLKRKEEQYSAFVYYVKWDKRFLPQKIVFHKSGLEGVELHFSSYSTK